MAKKKKFLVTADHYSDFFEIDEFTDLTAKSTIKICKRNFSRHGIPVICVTNGGPNFTAKEFKKFANEWEFTHKRSDPHHKQANDRAEAAVKICKRLIKKAVDDDNDFYKSLLQWRNKPNKIGTSPNQRMFSRRTRNNIPMLPTKLQPSVVEKVKDKIIVNRQKSKIQYDRKTINLPDLSIGDSVMARVSPEKKIWEKAQISNRTKDRSYIISCNDKNYNRTRVHIKPFNNETVITEEQHENIQHENLQRENTQNVNLQPENFQQQNEGASVDNGGENLIRARPIRERRPSQRYEAEDFRLKNKNKQAKKGSGLTDLGHSE